MNYLIKLQEMAKEIKTTEEYNGYFYKASDVITILVIGLMCNLRSAHEIYQWSRSKTVGEILSKHFGIMKLPCYAQFMNILGNIKADSLDKIFIQWCQTIIVGQIKDKTIAIDGKTICTTANMQSFDNPLHIVSAYISEYGLTIGQVAVSSKSNEIPATQALIKMINVQDAIVVADALNCQRETAKIIVDGGGDYLLAVKENQKDLCRDIELLFQTESKILESFKTSEKGHGRIETRTAWVSKNIEWYENRQKWLNLSCFGAVERVCEAKGKTSREIRYYISSRKLTAKELLTYSRNEWGVESMHWVLDVVFNEDRTTLMEKDAQRTLNTLRKTALNVIRMYKTAFAPKSSLVSIMRDNLFEPDNIPAFLKRLGEINILKEISN